MTHVAPDERPPSPSQAARPGLTVEAARARVLADLPTVSAVERVPVRRALDRVLGADVIARVAVPAHTNSAMDGYALRGADLPRGGMTRLRVIGQSFAGHPFSGALGPGQCVRIMTGAVMPTGADTVVIQEDVTREADEVRIGAGHRVGQHVRAAGEDLAAGSSALARGQRVGPAELGLIASLGIAEVEVYRRLRVAFFSTGDELRSLGEPLGSGDIYDSNRYTLHGMLRRMGAETLDLGVVRDAPEALGRALETAAAAADVVITTGGVSVGAADHVRSVLAEVGQIDFWKVNMKPGKPLAYGRLAGQTVFFGLPGNPVSTMVTFYQFVQPALDQMAGGRARLPLALMARSGVRIDKRHDRREFQRGCLGHEGDGALTVRPAAPQGSGILRSMSLADCFIVIPEAVHVVEAGALVRVELFAGLA